MPTDTILSHNFANVTSQNCTAIANKPKTIATGEMQKWIQATEANKNESKVK